MVPLRSGQGAQRPHTTSRGRTGSGANERRARLSSVGSGSRRSLGTRRRFGRSGRRRMQDPWLNPSRLFLGLSRKPTAPRHQIRSTFGSRGGPPKDRLLEREVADCVPKSLVLILDLLQPLHPVGLQPAQLIAPRVVGEPGHADRTRDRDARTAPPGSRRYRCPAPLRHAPRRRGSKTPVSPTGIRLRAKLVFPLRRRAGIASFLGETSCFDTGHGGRRTGISWLSVGASRFPCCFASRIHGNHVFGGTEVSHRADRGFRIRPDRGVAAAPGRQFSSPRP